MAIWDDTRYNRDGQPVAPYTPQPPVDIESLLRNVTTLKGVLPHGCVDPRAVDYGQPVTVLSRGAYDGQVVRYRHTDGEVPWLCIWDSTLNDAAGAWSVVGGGYQYEYVDAAESSSSIGWTNLATVGPTVTLKVGGVYEFSASAGVIQSAAGGRAYITLGGTAIVEHDPNGVRWQANAANENGFMTAVGQATMAVGDVSLRYRVEIGGTAMWFHRKLLIRPVELRP